MSEAWNAWWRARTPRERLLISLVVWLALVIATPLAVWQAAGGYRVEAAAALAEAEGLRGVVARLDPEVVRAAPLPGADAQAIVTREAAALQLTIERIEPAGPEGLRIVLAPGDSLAALTLIDRLTRAGLSVDRTRFVRIDEAGLVQAELDVARAGS